MEPATAQTRASTLSDPAFLRGLETILQPYYARGASQDEIDDVVKRAEAFFLSSQVQPDLEQPQPQEALTSVPPASNASASSPLGENPPYPPSFAELAQLIASGAPIPGVRDIPDELAAGEPSEAKHEARRKPWEKAVAGEMAGTVGPDGERMEENP
ncbi:DUF5572 domain-containing protein [Rhodotorula paludigena]|uniref:DUF5572 domain-containing protein n=1 Tax=Rhodotorula paludigena TaxID=86838 RepID=UPI00316CD39A